MSTVLIVDDEQPVLRALKRLLHRDDYRLITADNGAMAMDLLREEEIAVIVCDQRMPRITGAEVLSAAYRLQPESVRITLTGYSDFTSVQRSVNDGHVQQLLLKPWDDDHLRTTIADAVRSFEQRQEHKRLTQLVETQKTELESLNAELERRIEDRTRELKVRCTELNQMRRELEQSLCDTVNVLAETLESHSPNVGFHSKRVAELASRIALRLGLDEHEMKDVEFAARLHELGRITGPPSKGADDDPPTAPSAQHIAEVGHRIVSRVTGFGRVAEAILRYPTPFDQKGAGESLPLASRILAVANAYDDISRHLDKPTIVRRRAAADALREAGGSRLDPRIVDATLRMFDDDARNDPIATEVQISALNVHEGMVLARSIENSEGILLLKEGTELTERMIERIRRLGLTGDLLDGVWVFGASDAPAAAPPAHRTPTAAPSTSPMTRPALAVSRSPVADAPHETPQVEVFDISAEVAKARREILVVDDSLMICNAIRRELRIVGVSVSIAGSGESALQLLKTHRFCAAIVDLMMPEMSGREVVQRLRQIAPTMKCVILTGNATRSAVLSMAGEPNVAAFLTKPWTTERLVGAIEKAINGGLPE
ncbi:MAG TPA: response regulator [Phycisphaerae bacterium]|nr:response regulator [Phycisphaerae bacterium]HRW53135.1 response regulator [Phycisphaerae bacterium]